MCEMSNQLVPTKGEYIEMFIKAFGAMHGICSHECVCGKVCIHEDQIPEYEELAEYDDPDEHPGFEISDCPFGSVKINDQEYSSICGCWHEDAISMINVVFGHKDGIANLLTAEKRRLEKLARRSSTVLATD